MINEVIIEGIAIKNWKYLDDLFVRLASYRDPDLPNRPYDAVRDLADYVNVRLPGQARSAMNFTRGMRVRVHGFLQSRDYAESLEDFLRRAKPTDVVLPAGMPNATAMRAIHEIVAQRVVVLEMERAEAQPNTRSKRKRQPKPAVAEAAGPTEPQDAAADTELETDLDPGEDVNDLLPDEEIVGITTG